MSPDNSVIRGGVPKGVTARALVERGKAMAIYLREPMKPPRSGEPVGPTALEIELAEGVWQAEWLDTKSGNVVRSTPVEGGGVRAVDTPTCDTDIALRLRRQ